MTIQEFSDLFDTLVDSYRRFKDFDNKEELDSLDFNEYEKSVFLTLAQLQVVINLYNGRLTGDSFERTLELRRYLDELIVTAECKIYNDTTKPLSTDSYMFALPKDILFITYELAILSEEDKCLANKELEIVPVTLDDYHKIKDNPFRGANKRRILRLDYGNNIAELISKYNIGTYLIRYIKYPSPIILTDLPNDLTIDKISTKTECSLNPAIHLTILELAVSKAIQSKVGGKQ